MLLFRLVFTVRISLLLLFFFFPRGVRGHAVVMVNDLFRIFRFFGSEESVRSKITNPFLGSPRKTHPYCWFYSLDNKRVLTFPSKLFLDSPQISVSFNVQDAGRVLVPKIVAAKYASLAG